MQTIKIPIISEGANMVKNIIYIAGKITGEPNFKEKFNSVEEILTDLDFEIGRASCRERV